LKRRHAQLAKLADRQDPKGYGLRLHSTSVCSNHSGEARRKAPSYGHETMDTRNGVTSCGSSPALLAEQATNRKPQAGGMPQEAKALGNARDRLTWGGYTGRHRHRKVKGLMAGVFDALKTAEYTLPSNRFRCQATTMVRFVVRVPMTTARMLRSRVRSKVSSTVL
jgi:hypothetical protein